MILTNILYRTFFIKAALYGSAFTLDVDGTEYLVTARHLLDESLPDFELSIFKQEKWQAVKATVIGHGRGELDISVLKLPIKLTDEEFAVTPTIADLALGQDVYFLGFPYKMWGDVGNFMDGLPCPFAKKGTLSSLGLGKPQVLYVDAINNEGFSGGPLFFYPMNNLKEIRVAGIVSKFRVEEEPVLNADGSPTGMKVPYNTGFLVAYSINHALDIIRARPVA